MNMNIDAFIIKFTIIDKLTIDIKTNESMKKKFE